MALPDQLPTIRQALAPNPPRPHEGPKKSGKRLSDKDTYGPVKLARLTGLKQWQIRRARDTGVMAGPDLDNGRWSPGLAQSMVEGAP